MVVIKTNFSIFVLHWKSNLFASRKVLGKKHYRRKLELTLDFQTLVYVLSLAKIPLHKICTYNKLGIFDWVTLIEYCLV